MTKQHGSAGAAVVAPRLASPLRIWLFMSAESLAHRGENFFRKGMLLTRTKPRVERSGENVCRHPLLDGGLHRPSSLPRIRNNAPIAQQAFIPGQSGRGEVEQPGTDDTAATPHFGNVGKIEIKVSGFRQRRGVLQNVESFRIGL